MKLKDKLGFSLPVFQRTTWVSETLKEKWEPFIVQLPELITDVFTSVEVLPFIPVQIRNVPVHKTYETKKKLGKKGFFAEHVDSLPPAIQYAFSAIEELNDMPVIFGQRRDVLDFIKHINDFDAAGLIARLPAHTIEFWDQFINYGLKDKQWAYLFSPPATFRHDRIFENNLLNTCWNRAGISAIPYNPRSLDCTQSIETAEKIREIAKNFLPVDFFNAWTEILSWPAEWSALHGIAEIKTPLFKMICNTDATGTKYTIQFISDSYPADGQRGLLFPYKKPERLLFSGSEKFRRGQNHLDNSLRNQD